MATGISERVELWKKGAKYRCSDCEDKSLLEVAKNGCEGCGLEPAPTRENTNRALHIYAEEMAATNRLLKMKLDDPPTGGNPVTETREDRARARDQWVEKNRKDGESKAAARVRWWKSHPDQVEASRSATSARPKQPEKTIGEIATAAIDKRARSWHLEGRFIDVNLPELRRRVRKSVPGLTDLERSTEPASRLFEKSKSEAHAFVAEWS